MNQANKTLCYDVECVNTSNGYSDPGWCPVLVGTWRDYDLPNDDPKGKYEVFYFDRQEDKKKLQNVIDKATRIVGYNSRAADDEWCRKQGIQIVTNSDVLQIIWSKIGTPISYISGKTPRGYDLDTMAQANLGKGKIPRNNLALRALHDVKLTKKLYKLALDDVLVDPYSDWISGKPQPLNINEERFDGKVSALDVLIATQSCGLRHNKEYNCLFGTREQCQRLKSTLGLVMT